MWQWLLEVIIKQYWISLNLQKNGCMYIRKTKIQWLLVTDLNDEN